MGERLNGGRLKASHQFLHRRNRLQGAQQRQTVARGKAVIADLAKQALHVRHVFQRLSDLLGGHIAVLQSLYRVKARLDGALVGHGVFDPAAQKPCPHGRMRFVQKPQQ